VRSTHAVVQATISLGAVNRPPWHRATAALMLIAVVTLGTGCSATRTVTTTASTQKGTQNKQAPTAIAHHVAAHLNNPAQQPEAKATISCGEAKIGHACASGTVAPSNPNQSRQRNCDTNIVANSATSCSFAENTFYEYYESPQNAASGQTIRVHSPTTGSDYSVFCGLREGLIACTGVPLSTGIYVSFPSAAVVVYTQSQASAYANSRDVGHPGPATPSPTSRNESRPEVERPPEAENNGEEEGPGSYSHAEDSTFCSSHECIPNFPNGHGTVVECSDSTWSHSGGVSGACSDHGGEKE
jgi:hypothetical protein